MAKQSFVTGQVLTAAQLTSLQQTAMSGGAASAKTANYVLVAADAGTAISMTSTSATTITVNTGLFAAGDTVFIQNLGSGVSTITAGTATVNTSASLALAQYEGGTLYFTSASASLFFKADGAAPASSSQILQIVQGTYSTETASTSGTLADTGLTATITPSSASNKILVLCTQAGLGKTATSALDNAITIQLNRGGSDIAKITGYAAYTGSNLEVNIGNTSISYLDAPATTSATIYKTRFKREGTGGSAKVQIDSSLSVMTLLEITGV
jgi:hypothetical protein